ncbi:GntR family transcriptional regulator [Geodermatophilus sp. SYSU D00766]
MTTSTSTPQHGHPALASLDSGTLPARIHEILEDAIIQGVFAPGERLHTDRLAAQYGVSRIPVREAMRSLHEAGWVDIRPRYGAYVRERSGEELTALFEARAVIEGAIAEWAAQRRTPADLEALRRVVDRSRRLLELGDDEALERSGSDFYAAMRTASHNEVLGTLSTELHKRARFYFHMVAGDLGSDWVSLHEQLADLVGRGDAAEAGRLARQHVLDTGEAVAQLLGEQDAREAR